MGAKDKCNSKEKGCPTFKIKQVKYNSKTCDLTNNFAGIEFEIEGSDTYPDLEQYRLLLNATTNTKFIEFSADISGANPGTTPLRGSTRKRREYKEKTSAIYARILSNSDLRGACWGYKSK